MRPRFDSKARLRLLLGALLLGLAVPAWLLIRQASSQLDLEAFRGQQLIAGETARRIDAALAAAIALEEARPFADYEFVTVPANAPSNVVQRSPLSVLPSPVTLPGVIGHFQVDAAGRLTTPLLPLDRDPADFGLSEVDRAARLAIEQQIRGVLGENRLVRATPGERERRPPSERSDADRAGRASAARAAELDRLADDLPAAAAVVPETVVSGEPVRGQAVFDELAASNVREEQARAAPASDLDAAGAAAQAGASAPAAPEPAAAKAAAAEAEESLLDAQAEASDSASFARRIATFEADLEPYQLSRLDTGHLVLFRNAWRDGARFIQGLLLDQDEFLRGATADAFRASGHAPATRLLAAIGTAALVELTPAPTGPTPAPRSNPSPGAPSSAASDAQPLYATRLSPPLAQIELSFVAGELPPGPAERVLWWTAFVLGGVLLAGVYAIYRFGLEQIELSRQHEDFVSAVSHELKTPLTSIRMYGEMLKSGWADEQKKQTYYDYIFAEGERLSRLIDNVLQIARLNRSSTPVSLEPHAIGELVDVVRSKVSTAVERARFELTIAVDPAAREARVLVDPDALVQVFINLVDNAIKFANAASRREIVISAGLDDRDNVAFTVRDFGPGIPQRAMKRLFVLFYRPDDERTRATAGTGIGLALVKQLVTAMRGRIDVRNVDPGAEFRLLLPRADS